MNIRKILLFIAVLCLGCAYVQGQNSLAPNVDGTVAWGFATGDPAEWKYTNVRMLTRIGVAMKIPYDKTVKGATVKAISVPFVSDNVSKLQIFAGATFSEEGDSFMPTDSVLATASYSGTIHKGGYTTVFFDEPVAIPTDGLFVGYTFNVTRLQTTEDAEAVVMVDIARAEHSLWLMSGTSWGNNSWTAYPTAMLAHVAGTSLPDVNITLKGAEAPTAPAGSTAVVNASVVSNSAEPITAVTYTVEVGGTAQTYTQTLATPVPAGFKRRGTLPLTFQAPAAIGPYEGKLTLTAFNGKASQKAVAPVSFASTTLGRIVERHSIVEESTGTGCLYCPRGWVAMEYLKQHEPHFIGISVHNYNGDDAMVCPDYPNIFTGSPTSVIDRKNEACDAYYGTFGPLGIRTDFATYNAEPADVDIQLSATFSADGNSVNAKAAVEYLGEVASPSIAFVLTADSLRGNTALWRQKNTWGSSSKEAILLTEAYGGMNELGEFGAGGKYGSNEVFIHYNDVCIAHSFHPTTGKSQAQIAAGTTGSKVESAYTLALPTRNVLLQALHRDQIYAVAFVMDADGKVCNAARVRVEEPTGLNVLRTTDNGQQTEDKGQQTYDLAGRRLTTSPAAHTLRISGGKKHF